MPKNSDVIEAQGKITDVMPGQMYKVMLENGHTITAYTAGKMRQNRIRLVAGDTVKCEISPYDLQKGRITYRM
jgi:translation initiation factor IF-1